jgi:hypothetical protein
VIVVEDAIIAYRQSPIPDFSITDPKTSSDSDLMRWTASAPGIEVP